MLRLIAPMVLILFGLIVLFLVMHHAATYVPPEHPRLKCEGAGGRWLERDGVCLHPQAIMRLHT